MKAGSVIYLAAEGHHGFRARIAAFRQVRLAGVDERVPFLLIPISIDLVAETAVLIYTIRQALDGDQPVLVVLDTLNRTLRGSENSDEDMGAYIGATDRIREALDCAVLVVHHCGIEGSRPRGHTSLTAAADAQIAVKKNSNGTITATIESMKDGAEGDTFGSRLHVVEIGVDEDGDTMTSCIVEPAEARVRAGRKFTARQQRGLDVLRDLLSEAGEPPPDGPHFPAKGSVVAVSVWRERLFRAGVLDKGAKNSRQDFKRLKDGLAHRNAIREWDGLIWAKDDDE